VAPNQKRRHLRSGVNFFAVLRRLSKEGDSLPQIGYTRDISPDGTYCYIQDGLKKGDRIYVIIFVNREVVEGRSPMKVEGEGEVVRVEQACKILQSSAFDGVAVQFKNVPTVFM
jgi:hypothetical protein